MIYIVDGMDNCGTSKTIDSLMRFNKNTKRISWHCAKPPIDASQDWSHEYYYNTLQLALSLNNDGYDVYFDRCHLSECVYGSLYRGTEFGHALEIESILNFETNKNIRLLVLVGSDDGLYSRYQYESKNSQQFSTERTLFYNAFLQSTIKNKTFINVDSDNFVSLNEYIERVNNC